MDKELTLICGDAIEEMKKIPACSIRLIIADPPYNLGKDYGNNSDYMTNSDFISFSREWLKEASRILTEDGSIYIFMGMKYISYVFSILENEIGMFFNSWITWHYTQGIGKTRGYSPRHDDILFFTKNPKNYVFNLDDIRVPQKFYRSINNMRGANPGNVWSFSHMHYCNKNRQAHPTQKPEGVYERIVLASSNEGDKVLDPFVGSGTALRVCQQTSRSCIGIDINPNYIDLARRRLTEKFTGFDSIDERMSRVPHDLNDDKIRWEYIVNHIKYFLKNHPNVVENFILEVKKEYNDKLIKSGQMVLLDSLLPEKNKLNNDLQLSFFNWLY